MSGITIAKLQGSDYLSLEGEFKRWEFPDCDRFDLRSTIEEAEMHMRLDHFKSRVLRLGRPPCSSYFHLRPIEDGDGRVIGYATAQNSFQQGKLNYESAARARQLAGKRVTEVSGGSGANLAGSSPPIETGVTGLEESGAGQGVALVRPPL